MLYADIEQKRRKNETSFVWQQVTQQGPGAWRKERRMSHSQHGKRHRTPHGCSTGSGRSGTGSFAQAWSRSGFGGPCSRLGSRSDPTLVSGLRYMRCRPPAEKIVEQAMLRESTTALSDVDPPLKIACYPFLLDIASHYQVTRTLSPGARGSAT